MPRSHQAALSLLPVLLATWTPQAQAGYFANTAASAYLCTDSNCSSFLSNWPSNLTDGSYFYYSPRVLPNTQATIANGGSLESFTLSSSASADLASGSLRASAIIQNTELASDRVAIVSGTAWIGDSFSFASAQGGLFNWTNGGAVTLNIHLDGVLTHTTDDFLQPPTYNLQFAVRQHGAIQSTQGISLTPLGGLNWSQWSTVYGPGSYSASAYGSLPISAKVTGDLSEGGLDLQLSFRPGGDFDWDLVLDTSAILLTGLPGTKSADFSHTLSASFVAPAGAMVTSSSGVFPVTSAVPEPGTWALLLAGGLLLAARGWKVAKHV